MAESVYKRDENQEQKKSPGRTAAPVPSANGLEQHRNKQSDQQRWIAHRGARAASPSALHLWEQQR